MFRASISSGIVYIQGTIQHRKVLLVSNCRL